MLWLKDNKKASVLFRFLLPFKETSIVEAASSNLLIRRNVCLQPPTHLMSLQYIYKDPHK